MKKESNLNTGLRLLSLGLLIALVAAACAPAPAAAPMSAPAQNTSITGIVWQWTSLTQQGTTTSIPDPQNYTIIFNTDGTVTGKADCNTFSGTYSTQNGFTIKVTPNVMSACGTLDSQYLTLLNQVAAGGPDGVDAPALANAAFGLFHSAYDALHAGFGRGPKFPRPAAIDEQIFDENVHFHRLLAEASKNRVLAIVVESILAIVAHFRSLLVVDMDVPREVVSLHERLLDAIERGDPETAEAILEDHVCAVGERFRSLVEGMEARHDGLLGNFLSQRYVWVPDKQTWASHSRGDGFAWGYLRRHATLPFLAVVDSGVTIMFESRADGWQGGTYAHYRTAYFCAFGVGVPVGSW